MADFKIKAGYTVPILNEAKQEIADTGHPPFLGVCPVSFPGLKPKLAVKLDDTVKIGAPLFFDKKNPDIQFHAPASGRIAAINYGPRRVIEEIVIAADEKDVYVDYPKYGLREIGEMDRESLIASLLKGGMWPFLRRRPFNKIAVPDQQPKNIFVNCMDTAPLANDPNYSLDGKESEFTAGVAALKALCDRVHVSMRAENPNPMFRKAEGVHLHTFSGPHPAGLTGSHISRIDPINKGDVVWHLTARDTILIGAFLTTGHYPTERVVAVAGPGATEPRYYRARLGMRIADIVQDKVQPGEQRFISGNILSGAAKSREGFLGFYDDLITIVPEGGKQEFLGWLLPGVSKPSYTRSYLSGFLSKRFKMDTSLNGGHRAIIQSGLYERVVALDIHPEFLVKATLAEDVDAMERLGILECDPEDFALCTYLCPSKTEVSRIIAKGLDLMEREG